jgi:hypothetical protein
MDYTAEKQYRRVWRGIDRIGEFATDAAHGGRFGDDPVDAARATFADCWHLKDWLAKDGRIAATPKAGSAAVDTYVNGCAHLPIAADIANSEKHAGQDRRGPRSGAHLTAVNAKFILTLPFGTDKAGLLKATLEAFEGRNENLEDNDQLAIAYSNRREPAARVEITYTVGGRVYLAFDLAKKCMAEWDVFLAARGLAFSRQG